MSEDESKMPETLGDDATSKILDEYEELFRDRYTEKDEDYAQTLAKPLQPPPCVENWYCRQKRNYDWSRGNKPNHYQSRQQGGGWQNQQHDHYHQRRNDSHRNTSYGYGHYGDGRQDRSDRYNQNRARGHTSDRGRPSYGDSRHREHGQNDRYQPYGRPDHRDRYGHNRQYH